MRHFTFACVYVLTASVIAYTAEADAGVPLTDSGKGMTCHYYAANALLAWRQRGGDWTDADGERGGEHAYATQTVSMSNVLQTIEFDLTALAGEWMEKAAGAGTIYLRAIKGGRAGIVNFITREHPDSAAHPLLKIEWDDGSRSELRPSADTHFACPTHRSLGNRQTLQVGGDYAAALVFPFQTRPGRQVKRATLVLTSNKQYSGGTAIGAFRLDTPEDEHAEVRAGIAAKFVGDSGVEAHPAVVFAERFERRDWRGAWSDIDQNGDAEPVSTDSSNKFAMLDGQALRVRVRAGQRLGLSMHQRFAKLAGGEPEEIYFRYYLRFGEDWDPVATGGKLPGLAGTYERAGWGGRKPDGSNGWSARGAFFQLLTSEPDFNEFRAIGSYVYHVDGASEYGDPVGWNLGPTGMLQKNRWYSIEQHVKLNTPGAADGVLRAWIDGRLAYERTDLRYRSVPDLRIESVWMNVYHGGIAKAPADLTLYIDNLVVAHEYIGPAGGLK
ncbi:MAG: hypothetical protein JNK52_14330 [Zoogloeaceae bacterium]|nr:hypothetical protein [Zoogloeaceae bacterium]